MKDLIECEHCGKKTIINGETEICKNCGGSIFQSPEEYKQQCIIDNKPIFHRISRFITSFYKK